MHVVISLCPASFSY